MFYWSRGQEDADYALVNLVITEPLDIDVFIYQDVYHWSYFDGFSLLREYETTVRCPESDLWLTDGQDGEYISGSSVLIYEDWLLTGFISRISLRSLKTFITTTSHRAWIRQVVEGRGSSCDLQEVFTILWRNQYWALMDKEPWRLHRWPGGPGTRSSGSSLTCHVLAEDEGTTKTFLRATLDYNFLG